MAGILDALANYFSPELLVERPREDRPAFGSLAPTKRDLANANPDGTTSDVPALQQAAPNIAATAASIQLPPAIAAAASYPAPASGALDFRGLNPDAGDLAALDRAMSDPYAEYDRKKRADDAAKATLSAFDGGAKATPFAGVSGQQVMNIGPFGSLSPFIPKSDDAVAATPTPAVAAPVQPAPAPAPAPAQVPQAKPIAIGDYMMPRIGPASAYETSGDTAALPPNATSTEGKTVDGKPAVPETSLAGRIGKFLIDADAKISPHTATLLALAGGLAGAPSIGTGLSRGFTAAAAALPMDQKLAMQNQGIQQTYKALVGSGVPPQLAIASVYNPDILKSTVQSYIADRKGEVKTVKDAFGGERLVLVNPYDTNAPVKELTPGQGGQGAGTGGMEQITNNIAAKVASGASRDEVLKEVPDAYRPYVDAIVSGKGVPANIGRGQIRGAVMTLAHAVDPTFDETLIPTRIQMRKDFAGEGKNGQAIASFNTAQHHIDKLSDDLEQLSKYNGNFPTINAARGWLANNANTNPKLRDSLQAVNDDMAAVSHEVANAYNAGHLSDHDMAIWQKLTSSDLPPDQLRRGIADFVDLLNGKRDSLNHMYHQTFGQDAPSIEKEKNDAITSKVHQRLMSGGDKAAEKSADAAPVAVATKADYDKLPKGRSYVAPDGTVRTKQ